MLNTEMLDEYNNYEYNERETGRPQWFKCWGDKYADAIDIDNLDDDLTDEEKEILFKEVGKAFINALFLFRDFETGNRWEYKPHTRDGRILWNALRRDIEQSYKDYEKRVFNGAKGGRPKRL